MKSREMALGRITIVLAILLCVCGINSGWSQQSTGGLSGSVTDPTGALVPQAILSLTNIATGVTQTAKPQSSGSYYFDYLTPGMYSLKAAASGFSSVLVNNIQIEVGHKTVTDIHLQVGHTQQEIQVSADEAPLINTVDAQVSTNIPERYLQQLGSASRDALSYAALAPGVRIIQQTAAGAGQSLCITCGDYAGVNGSWAGRSSYYLDGIDNFGSYRNYSLQFPSPDAIQSVSVMTSNTSAEYGGQMGGAINVITKSGTNDFHGNAFYFFSPVELSSNNAGNKLNGAPRVPNNLKEVGGTLGGPIIRNKTHFFLSYQRYSNSNSALESSVRPGTPAMMLGNFSGLLTPTATSGLSPVQLYDPNYPGRSQPIPNNDLTTYVSPRTGSSLLDPVGLNLAKLMPTVANYGDVFEWQFNSPQVNDELLFKIDQSITNNQHLTVSFFGTNGNETLPAMLNNYNNVPNWGPEKDTANQIDLAVHYVWVASPHIVVQPFFSMAFSNADRGNTQVGQDLGTLGASNVPTRQEGARRYLPNISFNGMTAGDGFLSVFDQRNFEFGSTVTLQHNQHETTLGFSMQHVRLYQYNDQDSGSITFNGAFATGVYGAGKANDTGSSLADMLMGHSEGFSQTGVLSEDLSNWNDYFFAQDQWKIAHNIVLTPGLRYELYLPTRAVDNKMSIFKPGYQSTLYPNAYLGMAFPGDPGISAGLYPVDHTDIAPRLGVAWDVRGDGHTSLRAGLGWFFSTNPKQNTMTNAEAVPWHPKASCQATIISNPWLDCNLPSYAAPPTPFSVSPESLRSLNWAASFGSIGAVAYAPGYKNPYSVQWNVTAEHQFSHNITVSTAYVGSHGFRLTTNIPLNWARYESTANLQPANLISREPYSSGAYAGTGAGLYTTGLVQQTDNAEYYYNGWQTTFTARPVKQLEVRANYEFAHGQTNGISNDIHNANVGYVGNPTAPFASWGNYQAIHVFKAYYLWSVPFHPRNRFVNAVAGGWNFSGDVNATSGAPQNITLGYDWAYDGLSQSRPSLNGPIKYTWKKTPQRYIQYLDIGNTIGTSGLVSGQPVAQRGPWTLPGGGTDHSVYGNAPLDAVWLPGTWSSDATLLKDFHFSESKARYAEFRMEAFNVFNHEVHGCFDSTYTDPNFGQLTCNAGARTVQLGIKVYF